MTNLAVEKKDTPLLLKGPLVLATMQRKKTWTRRPLERQPVAYKWDSRKRAIAWHWMTNTYRQRETMVDSMKQECPYGFAGDRLWIRETMKMDEKGQWFYAADGAQVMLDPKDKTAMLIWAHHRDQNYCPSIHMPRWACRVRASILEIRAEPVTDITVEDIIAEGFSTRLREHDACVDLRDQFEKSWNGIYPRTPFVPDTWVYAIRYRLLTPGR